MREFRDLIRRYQESSDPEVNKMAEELQATYKRWDSEGKPEFITSEDKTLNGLPYFTPEQMEKFTDEKERAIAERLQYNQFEDLQLRVDSEERTPPASREHRIWLHQWYKETKHEIDGFPSRRILLDARISTRTELEFLLKYNLLQHIRQIGPDRERAIREKFRQGSPPGSFPSRRASQ